MGRKLNPSGLLVWVWECTCKPMGFLSGPIFILAYITSFSPWLGSNSLAQYRYYIIDKNISNPKPNHFPPIPQHPPAAHPVTKRPRLPTTQPLACGGGRPASWQGEPSVWRRPRAKLGAGAGVHSPCGAPAPPPSPTYSLVAPRRAHSLARSPSLFSPCCSLPRSFLTRRSFTSILATAVHNAG